MKIQSEKEANPTTKRKGKMGRRNPPKEGIGSKIA
jgi:hypothetical protein